jgi:hypothetical protein
MVRVVALVDVEKVDDAATDAGYSKGRWSCRKVGDVSARVMAG